MSAEHGLVVTMGTTTLMDRFFLSFVLRKHVAFASKKSGFCLAGLHVDC